MSNFGFILKIIFKKLSNFEFNLTIVTYGIASEESKIFKEKTVNKLIKIKYKNHRVLYSGYLRIFIPLELEMLKLE